MQRAVLLQSHQQELKSGDCAMSSDARPSLRLPIALFLTLLAVSSVSPEASAEVVIVGVRSDLPYGTTPEELIEGVKDSMTPKQRSELGNPIDAFYTYGFIEYPVGFSIPIDSAIHDMRSFVSLVYPSGGDAEIAEQMLRSDGRFGYVGYSTEGGFSSPLVPTDQFYPRPSNNTDPNETGFQWGMHALKMAEAWGYSPGWGRVGMLEGAADLTVPDLADRWSHFGSMDVYSFQNGITGFRNIEYIPALAGYHGTHSDGIAVATANNPAPSQTNGRGVSGACQTCALQHISAAWVDSRSIGARWLTHWGAQVINLSGFISDSSDPQALPTGYNCPAFQYGAQGHVFCAAIKFMRERDVVFVAAAGNNKGDVQFPARDPLTLAVGGIDVLGNVWDESIWGVESGDNSDGCPTIYNPSGVGTLQCGSNTGASLDFVAPARKIVSTVAPGSAVVPSLGWSDAGFLPINDGYGYMTGTSMAAPHVSGLVGLLRSIQPLAKAPDVVDLLAATSSGGGTHSNNAGWGLPDAGSLAERALGRSQNSQLQNRLTPMFVLKNDVDHDRLYTTNPTMASAAVYGEYMVLPRCERATSTSQSVKCYVGPDFNGANGAGNAALRPYESVNWTGYVDENNAYHDAEATAIHVSGSQNWPFFGYSFPGLSTSHAIPTSSFYVFTTNRSVLGTSVKPLYKLAFDEECDRRDHVYATSNSDLIYFTTTDFCSSAEGVQSYYNEGVEGYVLSSCPVGSAYHECKTLPPPFWAEELPSAAWPHWYGVAPQALYRRYNPNADEGYILLLESQLSLPEFSRFSASVNGSGPIGYVFPNVDSDGDEVVDGQELLLGSYVLSNDSDCDSEADGSEYPVFGYQAPGKDPRSTSSACVDSFSLAMTTQIIQSSSSSKTIRYIFTATNKLPTAHDLDVRFDWWMVSGDGAGGGNFTFTAPPGCSHTWNYGFICTSVAAGASAVVTWDATIDSQPPGTLANAGKVWAILNEAYSDAVPDNNVVYFSP